MLRHHNLTLHPKEGVAKYGYLKVAGGGEEEGCRFVVLRAI